MKSVPLRRMTGSFVVGALVALVAITVTAQAATIVNDSWTDGGRDDGPDPLDSNWWTSASASGIEVSARSLGMVTGTSGRGIHTVFPIQTLANIGDSLVATYTFRTPATVGTNGVNGFRVGLFDTLSRAELDADVPASSGSPNALYGWGTDVGGPGTAGLPGYMFDMDVGTGTENLNFRAHDAGTTLPTGRLMGTTVGFMNLTPGGPAGAYAFAADHEYTGSFRLTRTSATEMELMGTLGTATHSVTDTFDSDKVGMLAFWANSNLFGVSNTPGEPNNGLDYSNVTIEFTAAASPLNEWSRVDGGAWHTAGNWLTGAVPNSNAETARLWTAISANGTVDLAATNTTVRSLSFRNSAGSYTVVGTAGGRLTLESNSGNASIALEPGNLRDHTISAGLTLGSNTDISIAGGTLTLRGQQNWGGRSVTVNSGLVRYVPTEAASNMAGSTLTIAAGAEVGLAGSAPNTSDGTNHVNVVNQGQLSVAGGFLQPDVHSVGSIIGSGTTTVGAFDNVVVGGGTLTAEHIRQAALNIGNGSVVTTRAGGGTSVLESLTLFGTPLAPLAKFDLNNNAAVINYAGTSPAATVRQQILAGRGSAGLGAAWTGPGITSSAAAAAVAAEPESRSVGYAENSALPLGPYTTFRGQPLDSTAVLMAFTRTSDANLDGVVNDDDVTIVGASYAPGVPGASWATGDFDYNGFVDDDDVTLLGVFYDPSAAPLIAPAEPEANKGPASAIASVVAAVPEPATIALLALAAVGLFGAIAHGERACVGAL